MLRDVWPLLEGHHLNIIGGCCGTTDSFIRLVAKAVEPVPGIRLSPRKTTEPIRTIKPVGHASPIEPIESKRPLFEAIVAGRADEAVSATRDALAAGAEPQAIVNEEMIAAMGEMGRRFEQGKAFVPQLLMAGRAMKAALEVLKPLMAEGGSQTAGKVVIGTVKGDLHDIGKNLVASMLEGNGFEVVNIGVDIDADTFVQAVKEHNPDILCLSALLTTTMEYMKVVIDALKTAGLRDKVKVMVGGAPVSQSFADTIGADGYGDNANAAVTTALSLIRKETCQ
ncbi:MAG: cobalamin-dependent protein [Prevotella sp.]|nr:cobalamin-dependent protein [Prevotella sp.]